MLRRHTPCRYVITLRYTFLQRYMEVGYSPLYIYTLLTLGESEAAKHAHYIQKAVALRLYSILSNFRGGGTVICTQ